MVPGREFISAESGSSLMARLKYGGCDLHTVLSAEIVGEQISQRESSEPLSEGFKRRKSHSPYAGSNRLKPSFLF
jgi:hypothetical protein